MNISKIITTCIAIFAFVSCTDSNDWKDGTRTPSLKASFIYFPQSQIDLGGTSNLSKTVQLQAVETPWKFSNPVSDWLEVSPMEGSGDAMITFTAKANPTSDNVRTALVSLQSLDADYSFSRALTINQGRANSVLNLSDQNFELTREAQTKTVSITANSEWKTSCSVDWIHLTKISDTSLEINIDENNGIMDRQAYINITGSTSTSITILQHGYKFEDLVSELVFENKSSTKKLNIKTDGAWTTTSNESWIQVSPKSGIGNAQLSVSVDNNNNVETRKGTISVTVGDVTKYVSVQQKGAYLNISTSSGMEISPAGGTRTVTFSTSDDWTVVCQNPSWVTVDKMSGTAGINTITLTFSENTQGTDRTNITYIKSKNTNLQNLKITTIQKGDYFYDGHEYVDLGLPSGTLWATCNIGASKPEECGDYFAWGETTAKSDYNWDTYKWCNGSSNTMTKYCTNSGYGLVDNKRELDPEDDAATANWGNNWCMPTYDQAVELLNSSYTTTEWNNFGLLIKSKFNGNTLFLPATGYFYNKWKTNEGSCGEYWCRSIPSSKVGYTAYELFFNNENYSIGGGSRYYGHSIRPVVNK